MAKEKLTYICNQCEQAAFKWTGQCNNCHAWNSLEEALVTSPKNNSRFSGYAGEGEKHIKVFNLADLDISAETRIDTHLAELNRVLGGGIVQGSVSLLGGSPGIGKSTLLLQTIAILNDSIKTLYITGEESLSQIKLRASRLNLANKAIPICAATSLETIFAILAKHQPNFIVLDSIQTTYTEILNSAPGSVSQVRETAAQLVKYAKQNSVTTFLVGHVTKEGSIAEPRILEHMVDTVLYFEGNTDDRFRIIRAVKNRFGAVNELGIFAMTQLGLRPIDNPSAIFLSRTNTQVPGSIVMVTWEGSRAMLIEVQALVAMSQLEAPKRTVVGLDQQRLALILAILYRYGKIITGNQDIFVNIVGGVKITETAVDLPMLLAIVSSLKNHALPKELIAFGELGLGGEVRPIPNGLDRLKEAAKLGFNQAIIPSANAPKQPLPGLTITPVRNVSEALDAMFK